MSLNFYNLYRFIKESVQEPMIMPTNKDDANVIISLCDETVVMPDFTKACSKLNDWVKRVDWNKSIKLVLNDEVIGFYTFSFLNINDFIKQLKGYGLTVEINEDVYEKIKNKRGIEGVSLGLKKDYRGLGYGRKLLEYPRSLGMDYIWGVQTKGASNIDVWKKRREVLAHAKNFGQEFWITVQIF